MKTVLFLILAAALAFSQSLLAQNQTAMAETAKLLFHAAATRPGPVEAQVRGAMKDLGKFGRVVRVRVFLAAGTDPKVVVGAVEKMSGGKARPAVNVVKVARLADPAAKVLVEAVSESKKTENPEGVVFVSGQMTQAPFPAGSVAGANASPVATLAEKSLASVKAIVAGGEVVRVNCYASSLEDHGRVEALASALFPSASVTVMQIQEKPANQFVECEAVARMKGLGAGVQLNNPTGAPFAQSAAIRAPRVIFTSTWTSATGDEAGVRQVLSGLKSGLEGAASGLDKAFYVSAYPGSDAALAKFRAVRFEFLDRANAPASTNLVFDGDPIAVDAMAIPK